MRFIVRCAKYSIIKTKERKLMSDNQSKKVTDVDVLRGLTTDIVSSYLANNSVPAEQIPALIHQLFDALVKVGTGEQKPEALKPAVPIKKSVFPDYIICLEDGKKLKMLKRYLMSSYSMTPEEYRSRWGLPPDYPMVAPAYAEKRSALAREIGLGRKISAHTDNSEAKITRVPEVRRGRKKVSAE